MICAAEPIINNAKQRCHAIVTFTHYIYQNIIFFFNVLFSNRACSLFKDNEHIEEKKYLIIIYFIIENTLALFIGQKQK